MVFQKSLAKFDKKSVRW